MSLGSWDPDAAQQQKSVKLERTVLEHFIQFSRQEQLDQLSRLLSSEDQQRHAPLMHADKNDWLAMGESFDNEELVHLIRFFTMAEKLSGWEAGEHCPVIWLGKILKKRKVGISKELQVWIRANSDNRYLPHGPLI